MSATASNPLSSYDLIAKSIPGVVLLLIGSSFLPQGAELTGISVGNSIADYAITILTSLILGLFVGEAVHTLAELIEQTFLFIGKYSNILKTRLKLFIAEILYRKKINWEMIIDNYSDKIPRPLRDSGGKIYTHVLHLLLPIFTHIFYRIFEFSKSKYLEFYDSFESDGDLFAKFLVLNFSREPDTVPDRWKYRAKGHPYECFRLCVNQEFGEDVLKGVSSVNQFKRLSLKEEYKSLYMMVNSDVSRADVELSTRFQSVYSFCRSMYVIFGLVTLGYFMVLYPVLFGGDTPIYNPVAIEAINEGWYPLFIVIPLIMSVIFLISTKKYKRMYINQLICDFCTLKRKNLPEKSKYSN